MPVLSRTAIFALTGQYRVLIVMAVYAKELPVAPVLRVVVMVVVLVVNCQFFQLFAR